MSEDSDEELIGRWDATLAEAGPSAGSSQTFQPPGWGADLSGGTAGLPGLTLSGLPDAAISRDGVPTPETPTPEEAGGTLPVPLPEGPPSSYQPPAAGHESSVYDKTIELPDGGSGGPGAFDATQRPPDVDDSCAATMAGQPGAGSTGDGTSQMPGEAPLYSLEEVIGRGGMGVVYRAWQGSLQRSVALKRQIGLSNEASRRRFVAEAVATGRLDHPNIVPVYDLGTDPTGEVVLTMKLVDGVPWKTLLHPDSDEDRERAKGYDYEDHLRILVQVSNAIAFAHSRHIVHNDLKPENVMLGEFGEVLVMDWGLAVHIGEASEETSIPHRTMLQAPCGTPAYMPPELADGAGERIGPWTDVYLLGSILHELVTGRAPHRGGTLHEVIVAAVRSKPPHFKADVPDELADICRRAMAKVTEDRYPEVSGFREALETYLTHRESHVAAAGASAVLESCDPARLSHEQLYAEFGEAIARYGQALELWSENREAQAGRRQARLRFAECALSNGDLGLGDAQLGYLEVDDESVILLRERISQAREERMGEERMQGRLRMALVLAVGLFVIGLVAGLALLKREAERTAQRAEEARAAQAVAEHAQGEAEKARHVAEGLAAMSLVGQGDALLTGGRPAEATRRFREAMRFFTRLGRSPASAELGLLSARRQSASPLIRHPAHEGGVAGLGFGPKGQVYSCGSDGRVLRISPLGEPFELAKGLGPLRALAVSPVGSWVAVGGEDGRVHLVSPQGTPRLIADLPGRVEALTVAPNGEALICGATEPRLVGWHLPSGKRIEDFPSRDDVHLKPVTGITITPSYLWVGDAEGRLVQWNAIRGKFAGGGVHWDFSRRLPRWLPRRPIHSLQFSENQAQFAFAIGTQVQVWHHTLRLIDDQGKQGTFNNYTEHFSLEGHHAPVSALAYVPGTHRLVTGGQDGRLLAWDVLSKNVVVGKAIPAQPSPIAKAFANEPILSLAASPDGALIAAGHSNGSVSIWDLGLAVDLRSGAERSRQPLTFVEPPDPPAALLKPSPRNYRAEVDPPPLRALAIGPHGNLAASGAEDGTLTLYDARGGRRLELLAWHPKRILALDLGSEHLLSVCADGWIRNWSLETLTSASEAAVGSASAAAISSGGRFVALGRAEGGVEIFDARTMLSVWRSPAASASRALALGPEGAALVSADEDGSLSYRSRTGSQIRLKTSQPATALALLGDRALVGDRRGNLVVFAVPSGARIAERRAHGSEIRALQVRGERVFSGGADGTWQIHALSDLTPIRSFRPTLESLQTLAIDREGRRVLVGGHKVELWDLGRVRDEDALSESLASARGAERERALGRSLIQRGQLDRGLPRLAESPTPSDALAVALGAWELERLDLAHRSLTGAEGAVPTPYLTRLREALARERSERCSHLGRIEGRVRGVWVDPQGARAISAGQNGAIDLWDLRNERRIRRIHDYGFGLSQIAVDPAGQRIAIGDRRGNLELWRIDPPLRLRRWDQAQRGSIMSLSFGAAGRLLYVAGYTKSLRVFSCEDGSLQREVKVPKGVNAPNHLTLSPDGTWLAAADGRRTLLLWRLRDFELKTWTYTEKRSGLYGLTFTPRGLVGYRRDSGTWVTYSLEGELLDESRPGPGYSYSAAVDPTRRFGAVVTSGRGEHPVTVWNLKTGEVVDSFPALEGNLHVAFGREGALFLGGTRGRISQWSPR